MPRPTRRALGLAGASLSLFLIGTNVQAGWLFVLGSLVLGAVAAGLVMPRGMVRGIAVRRSAPEEAFAGDDVPVDLVVTNTGRRTVLSVSIEDPHIAPVTVFLKSLAPRETVTLQTVRRAAKRGVVNAAPLVISSGAPFGVAVARRTVQAGGRTVIYPRVVPVQWLPTVSTASKPLNESPVRARKGAGHDFLGIREYRPGDSLRHVHWPTTARQGALMVREFEQELPRRMGIVVDTWADAAGAESALDVCCSIAASLTLYAMRAGHPVAVAAARDRRVEALDRPGREEALEWLAGLTAPAGPPLAAAIDEAAPLLGRLDTLALVFPTWRPNSADAIARAVGSFDDSGLQLIAAIVEADSFGASGAKGESAPPLAPAETDALAMELAARDVTVYRIRAKEDLAECLERPFAA